MVRMLRPLVPLFAIVLVIGCQSAPSPLPALIEGNVIGLAPRGAIVEIIPSQAAAPLPSIDRLDLHALWELTLSHNPALREAAADVEAARGRWVQAGLSPNPPSRYNPDTIGPNTAPQGNYPFEVAQEIVTAG